MLRPRVFPDAHEDTSAILLIGVKQLGERFAQAKDFRVLVPLEVDRDVNVFVALALELEFAEVSLLRSGVLGSFPFNLRKVIGL